MTIKILDHRKGNSIVDSKCDILVNAVNCVGIMGKGVAKSFADKFKESSLEYKRYCADGLLNPGEVLVTELTDGRVIIHAATKDHWRNESKIEWVDNILESIKGHLNPGESTLAIPLLGAGLGGLDNKVVMKKIVSFAEDMIAMGFLKEVEIYV